MESLVLFILVTFVGAVFQASTGFGFAILATPFMLLFLEPREAVQLAIILGLFISLTLMKSISKDVNQIILRHFIIGSFIGMPLGMVTFLILDVKWLKIMVSIIIILLTFLLILQFRIRQSRKKDVVVGGFAGVLSTSIGMGGPPIILYFSGANISKAELRSTSTAFFLIVGAVSLVIQLVFAGTTSSVWKYVLIAIPILILGLYIGKFIFERISQRTFTFILYGLLVFTGCYLLYDSIMVG